MIQTITNQCPQMPLTELTKVVISPKVSPSQQQIDEVLEQSGNNKELKVQKTEQNLEKEVKQSQQDNMKQVDTKAEQSDQQSMSNKDMSEGSTDSENKVLFSERSWNEEKDSIETEHSDSLSFVNVLASISLWCFLFLQIIHAIHGSYGWFIVAFFYIIYLFECYNCSIFKGITQRKATIEGLNQFVNQLVLQQPQITYQINKFQKINSSICTKPIQDDIENQASYQQNNSLQAISQDKKKSKKDKIQFEKNTISFEFDKMKNECLNLSNLLKDYNSFKLQVDVVSQIEDENSILFWNEKKQLFKDQHKEDQNCQVLSTVEYTKQEGEFKTYYINQESKFTYYSTFILFSLFSFAGLSVFFRFAFNIFFPTIRVKLVKHLSN